MLLNKQGILQRPGFVTPPATEESRALEILLRLPETKRDKEQPSSVLAKTMRTLLSRVCQDSQCRYKGLSLTYFGYCSSCTSCIDKSRGRGILAAVSPKIQASEGTSIAFLATFIMDLLGGGWN